MVTRKGTTTPVSRALTARELVANEKRILECTVGNAVRRLMDPEFKQSPDLADVYKKLGGKTEFTIRLLAETFGSKSLKKKGTYPLKPNTAPNLKAMTKALEDKALELIDKKVPGLGKKGVYNGEDSVIWIFESSPAVRLKCTIETNGGGAAYWD